MRFRRALLAVVLLLSVACGLFTGPPCDRGETYVEAGADTSYMPYVYPSGDTVQVRLIAWWTAGCVPDSLLAGE